MGTFGGKIGLLMGVCKAALGDLSDAVTRELIHVDSGYSIVGL